MKIAIEGCAHGELDNIYAHIRRLEQTNGYKVDLLLICGDFQAVRNYQDLQCMAVPDKYKDLREFYKYYTGEKTAPILTIVIGGNHEASNYMWELFYGGWLAPNIYYLGCAGCVQVDGIRIAGASGIFKPHDFHKGFYEKMPYDRGTMRSIYHIREFNVRKLSLLSSPAIFLSHDWPQSIEHYGNLPGLLARKRFLKPDIDAGQLGSPPLMGLLRTLKPAWWFAAHLHTKYEAVVVHDEGLIDKGGENPDEIVIDDEEFSEADRPASTSPIAHLNLDGTTINDEDTRGAVHAPRLNPDEIALDDEEADVVVPPLLPAPRAPQRETRFLALDKCLSHRDFLEVIDFPCPSPSTPPKLTFDAEWLAITRAFDPFFSTTVMQRPYPGEDDAREMVRRELEWVYEHVGVRMAGEGVRTGGVGDVETYQVFVRTAPGPGDISKGRKVQGRVEQPPWYTNPQTEAFCAMLQIENRINPPPEGAALISGAAARKQESR